MSTEPLPDPFDDNLRKLLAGTADEPHQLVATRLIPRVLQEVRRQQSRKRLRRHIVFSMAAAAAAALIIAGIMMLWRPPAALSPTVQEPALAKMEYMIDRTGCSVRLLATADLLAGQEGGVAYARETYAHIVKEYQGLQAAVVARTRLQFLSEGRRTP